MVVSLKTPYTARVNSCRPVTLPDGKQLFCAEVSVACEGFTFCGNAWSTSEYSVGDVLHVQIGVNEKKQFKVKFVKEVSHDF